DAEMQLTALEFNLLSTFMSRVGRLQSREMLLRDVWGMSGELQTRTVDTHVKRLREKLVEARDLLQTVRGSGYWLVDPEEKCRWRSSGARLRSTRRWPRCGWRSSASGPGWSGRFLSSRSPVSCPPV